MGPAAWNKMRKACYEKAGYKCEICGYQCEPGKMHCLERGTEVLTTEGWVPIEHITTNNYVAQFDPDTNKISFVNPTSTVSEYVNNVVRLGYKKGFSVRMSEEHRNLVWDKRKAKYETILAKDLRPKWPYYIPASGYGDGEDRLSPDDRLAIALQADGSAYPLESGGYRFIIKVFKQRKKEQLESLVAQSSLRAERVSYKDVEERGGVAYNVWTPVDCKKLSNWFSYNMSGAKATEFLDELVKWDGWEGQRNGCPGRCYYCSDKENIDFVQAIAAQAGVATHLTVSHRRARDWGEWHTSQVPSTNLKPAYNLEIKNKGMYGMQTMKKTVEPYNDDVFCITVPTHYFVARTIGGDVFITGNCHEVYSINYKTGESKFIRPVGLCIWCHLYNIHVSRALTEYKHGNPIYSSERLLEAIEHGFKVIEEWNKSHSEEEKIRKHAALLEYLRQDELKEPLKALIEKYNIEFYAQPLGKECAPWSDWKLLYNGKEYKTPYKDQADLDKHLKKADKKTKRFDMTNRMQGGVFDEIDNIIKEGEK